MQQTKYLTRQTEPMAESIGVKLLGWLGVPFFMLGVVGSLDELKAMISFIVGLVMLVVRFVYLVDKWEHAKWQRREERRKARGK
jgi:hypothetical protein